MRSNTSRWPLCPSVALIAAAWLLAACHAAPDATPPTTYCNPINIDYTYSVVHRSNDLSFRSGADPAAVAFDGAYYLFVTRSQGYWRSEDLRSWQFIRPENWYFESSNAPGAFPLDDDTLIALANPSSWMTVIYTDDPQRGAWRGSASLLPLTIHDPALFVDDDGRVYAYYGSSNTYPIRGIELDPDNAFLPLGEEKELLRLHPEEHGWERFGEHHDDTETAGYIEGPWMTKHNGRYYLQYAAPGTEWSVYGDGVYTADHPLGPFTYEPYSPFSYKPGGFIRGAGHGSTVEDHHGNFWHFATMVVGVNFNFERRIGQFPAGFDEDGRLYTSTAFGDYPHYLPTPEHPTRDDWFTGWMLLSYNKPVSASSAIQGHGPEQLVDENVKTFWVADSAEPGQWVEIDLERPAEVRAVQVNYADYRTRYWGKVEGLYHQYHIEGSLDGERWFTLADKRHAKRDVPNDYVELPAPRRARYVRFTNHHVPTPHLAIAGLRVFGRGEGAPPAPVTNFAVERGDDRRDATLTWDPVPGAQGYQVHYGIDPDQLYTAILTYDATRLEVRALNTDPAYYFQIEAFGENGVSPRSATVAAP